MSGMRFEAGADAVIMKLPRGERRCDTCALCELVDDHVARCVAAYEVPVNCLIGPAASLLAVARLISRRDVERWEGRRLRACPLWQGHDVPAQGPA